MKAFTLSTSPPILLVLVLLLSVLTSPAFGQQTGSISGTVATSDGDTVPGVLVEATSDVLPGIRATTTTARGAYRLVGLPPGNYEVKFSLDGFETESRSLIVRLQQNSPISVNLRLEGVTETVEVFGDSPVIDTSSAELKAAIDFEKIDRLPVGQEYRDLIKLIPQVQYTEDEVRGPSAGGNGQDNVYLFDGVNIGLPLFGTLSAEPSSHDIDQISVVRGGAKAIDFNRSGGFTINSISKSGTNQFHGLVSHQVQTDGLTGDRDTVSDSEFEQDKGWSVVSIGGPIATDRLFFYTSYYRPTIDRANRSNLYGEVPDLDSTRDELFFKLSWSASDSFLVNGSYRDSDREDTGSSVGGEAAAGSTSTGSDATLGITTLEGSWVASAKSFFSFKYTDFETEGGSRPDNLFGFDIANDGSVPLNVGSLDTQGLFLVPQPIAGEDAYNGFIQPLIDRYGYLEGGTRVGGGQVGGASTIRNSGYFRDGFEIQYDRFFGDRVSHELHFGYQSSSEEEDLSRTSNGWGVITVRGGRSTASNGEPIFYEARFEQQSLLSAGGQLVPGINSQFEQQSFEINDTIRLDNWTFNVGVVVSQDELFGEGLRPNSSNLSGFELAPGNKYKMYQVDYGDMIQPRVGAIWNFRGQDTVYANYARYNPAASSLPRAASWGRNLRRSIRGFFDAAGNVIETEAVRSSSGKFFQPDMDPRAIDEYLLGYSKQLSPRWNAKVHVRHRKGSNFWEDTNNNARLRFEPPAGIPQELYIPELADYRAEVGGSSYVIAELDGAFTEYYDAGLETNWRGRKAFVTGSYLWSHYYGNFDQDNTTTTNDAAIFLGSSFISDGAGRQLWDFREGDLRGDRRHMLKAYGSYSFDWNGSVGVFAVYQSGQPWEAWDVEVYRHLTGSTSDTSRFAEPAGSRTTGDHYQIDLNYTHNFNLGDRYVIQVRADIFNITDNQTGYNIQNKRNSSGFGDARSFFDPRRAQLAVKLQF